MHSYGADVTALALLLQLQLKQRQTDSGTYKKNKIKTFKAVLSYLIRSTGHDGFNLSVVKLHQYKKKHNKKAFNVACSHSLAFMLLPHSDIKHMNTGSRKKLLPSSGKWRIWGARDCSLSLFWLRRLAAEATFWSLFFFISSHVKSQQQLKPTHKCSWVNGLVA